MNTMEQYRSLCGMKTNTHHPHHQANAFDHYRACQHARRSGRLKTHLSDSRNLVEPSLVPVTQSWAAIGFVA
ncbi:uncharacterized protein K489DRAFT_58955 [Dissoconium aciculare CBS 342.82]|uniref:Uncharacterized protein n=1 Tax=Dissoconium aciculare CBS 342.82 TaxID=1314786 RepID=A0A6J3LVL0_9PEZI|nr:uncharacterized protein K489DRAFT_58955 [Dissoconium aciculare CBS 342.82]KAF1819800.1 hypothetical protein K489DRAFT_58955 [Dissoconium aciculare CBS 342.82]